jgi:hypothetical protein
VRAVARGEVAAVKGMIAGVPPEEAEALSSTNRPYFGVE